MAFNLRNRSFVKELDFTPEELKFLLKLSADLKAAKYSGFERQRLKGKNIALIFEKTSTRTPAALSRWRPMTRARTSLIWVPKARRSATRNL
jgi:ornithine carbamoyltransferase